VLAETAAEIIRRSRMPMYRRVLGLIDRDGGFTDLPLGLLRHYTSVKVVTAREDLYEAVAEAAMEELGAPVMVGSTLSLLTDCVLILAPGPAMGEEEGSYPCPVLAGEGFKPSLPCDLISDPEPAVSEELRGCCPPGISPHRFAAALFEDSGLVTVEFAAAKLRLCWRQAKTEEIVKYVTERAGILSFR
jgi:hypothetical protein